MGHVRRAAGGGRVSWQVYPNMADNFTDNPMAGFRRYRDAARGLAGFRRRFAGRVETGRDSLSDPAMGGRARGDQM